MHPAIPGAVNTVPRRAVTSAGYLLPLAPLLVMAWPVYRQVPGLQDGAGQVLGFGAALSLLACLAVTPVAALTGMRRAARWRRWLGMNVFTLGLAGLAIAVTGGSMSSGAVAWRAAGHIQQWTGTVIVVLLIPLAITSNVIAQKALGAHWKQWQRRLTWAAWAMITVHVALLWHEDVTAAWMLSSGPLLISRIPAVRGDVTRWRRGGYGDAHLQILTGMAAASFALGFGVLGWMEVTASAALYR